MYPIDFFWRAWQRWPQRTAIDTPNAKITYAQLASQVWAAAAGLRALDPTPQSRVGICATNSAEHIVALLATLACGKVWVPLNPKSTQPEIRRITDAIDASILLVESGYGDLVTDTAATRVWIGEAASSSQKTLHALLNENAGEIGRAHV